MNPEESVEDFHRRILRLYVGMENNAQNDLFRQAYFVSLARSGRKSEAREYFHRMSGDKHPSALDRNFLAQT